MQIRRSILAGLFLFSLAACAVHPAAGQQGDEPVGVTDLLQLRQIDDVAVSPGGRQVAYTVRSIERVDADDPRDSLAYRTHVFVADAGGALPPRQLTRGEHSAGSPSWHPNGDSLAFVRSVDGKPQVFVLPMLGGEAYQVTSFEHGASAPLWSPDGSKLLVAATLPEDEVRVNVGARPPWPLERPGLTWMDLPQGGAPDLDGSLPAIRSWLERNAEDGNPRVIHRLDFQGEHDLEAGRSFRHLFVVDVDTTTEPRMITEGYADFHSAAWLPDGEGVVAAGLVYDDIHPDHTNDSHLYVVDASGGQELLLDLPDHSLSSPAVGPDGRFIAFTAVDTSDVGYAQTDIGILPTARPDRARFLTNDFDRSVSAPVWDSDGWYLYFTAASNGGIPLYRLEPFESSEERAAEAAASRAEAADTSDAVASDTSAAAVADTNATSGERQADDLAADTTDANPEGSTPTPAIERLTSFDRGIQSFDVGRATVFFAATEPTNPYELYAANMPFTQERRLTSHNAGWLADKRISIPERGTVAVDTLEIEYWVMRPSFFDSTETYPLLVQMHGGPSAMWGPGEASMWHEMQFFASKGFGVVFANPRGSGGYGRRFRRANYQDWGAGPSTDMLAAVDEAERLEWVDTTRQVLTGGSYAGYLTAWIVAHDDRFRAAAAQRGVYDLVTFLGEGNAWRLVPSHFGGYPWNRSSDTSGVIVDAAPSSGTNPAPVLAPVDTTTYITVEQPTETIPSSPKEVFDANSPLTYVDAIRTPLLILHADDDLRTGVSQSEMLYRSLKILGRPVEYVRYPNAGHDPSRTGAPLQRIDRLLRLYEFFARFVE